jgi:hypothetical protein
LCCASAAFAQLRGGTEPKPKPEEYEVHAQAGDVAIGAEYMVHSFAGEGATYIARDFLVVEVALYPPKGENVKVNSGAFALRVNGGKKMIAPVSPTAVAYALQHEDWQDHPRAEGSIGSGAGDIIFGRPAPTKVPGGQQPRTPRAPRAPDPDAPGGVEPQPRIRADELVVRTALPEGDFSGPVSGFLYFPYKGKTTSIKSLNLVYGDAALKLR